MMIHISKDEAQTLLNAVQDAMLMARNELNECWIDEEFATHCDNFSKSFYLGQRIERWLEDDQKE